MTTEAGQEPLLRAVRRIASTDKIVRNRTLNSLGCQVGRVLAAEALLRLRRRRVHRDTPQPATALIRDGVACVRGFIAAGDFRDLLDEAERAERKLFTAPPQPDKFGIVRQKISVKKYPNL